MTVWENVLMGAFILSDKALVRQPDRTGCRALPDRCRTSPCGRGFALRRRAEAGRAGALADARPGAGPARRAVDRARPESAQVGLRLHRGARQGRADRSSGRAERAIRVGCGAIRLRSSRQAASRSSARGLGCSTIRKSPGSISAPARAARWARRLPLRTRRRLRHELPAELMKRRSPSGVFAHQSLRPRRACAGNSATR